MEDNYDWEEWDPSSLSFGQHMLAGCIAGVSEHVVFFPIDTLRTHLQAVNESSQHEVKPTSQIKNVAKEQITNQVQNNVRESVQSNVRSQVKESVQNNIRDQVKVMNDQMQQVQQITKRQMQHRHRRGQYGKYLQVKQAVRNDGYRVLWRGMSTTIVACIPAHALYFSIYESIKMRYGGSDNKLHVNASAIGGAIASMAHDGVMTPLDVLKQRMQLGLYAKPMDALRAIIRTEGFRALYSSYFTTILMNVPNAAVLVVTNDWMKSILNPSGKQNFSAFLVSGLVAGALSGFVTCPLDVIKTRIQTQNASGSVVRKYTGFWQTLKLMVKEEGVRSLFMGVFPRVCQQAPAAALSWTVYESVKRLLANLIVCLDKMVKVNKRNLC